MTDKVKVSVLDNTAEYLDDKLTAGSNITITKNESGGTETLEVTATYPTDVTTNTSNIAALDAETAAVRIKVIHGVAGSLVNKAVYITGWSVADECLTVEAADNTDPLKMPASGLVDTITDSVTGYMTMSGLYSSYDTSAYSEGDRLYIDETGDLTSTKPTGSDVIQMFATVGRIYSIFNDGQIFINGPHEVPASLAASEISSAGLASVGTIAAGEVCYLTSYDVVNSVATRGLAIADDVDKMPGCGVCSQAMTTTTIGRAVTSGIVTGIDTDSLGDIGDKLYVSAVTPGALTKTRPTSESNKVQHIATIVYKHATDGIINVVNTSSFEDVPNLDSGDFWLGGTGDTAESKVFATEADAAIVTHNATAAFTNEVNAVTEAHLDYNPTGSGQLVELECGDYTSHKIFLSAASTGINIDFKYLAVGQRHKISIVQHATVPINAIWMIFTKWPGGVVPIISTGSGAVDLFELYYDGFNFLMTVIGQDYS